MKRVVVSGWYGCGNVGDDALLATILGELSGRFGDEGIEFSILSEVPSAVQAAHGASARVRVLRHRSLLRPREAARALLSGEIGEVLRAIREANLFILGGGGLVQDANGVRNLVRYLDECVLAQAFGVPTMYFGVGVGPLVTPLGRRLARLVSERVALIDVRDRSSEGLLRAIGVRGAEVRTTADPALLLRAAPTGEGVVRDALARIAAARFTVAICPRPPVSWTRLAPADWVRLLRELARTCDRLVRQRDAVVVFVPFMAEDREVVEQVLSLVEERAHVLHVREPLSPAEVKLVLGRMRYVIGMRLHSLIFAASENVQPIGINYAPKVRAFCDELEGQGQVFEEVEFTADRCLAYIDSYEASFDANREALRRVVQRKKEAARRTVDGAVRLLGGGVPQDALEAAHRAASRG